MLWASCRNLINRYKNLRCKNKTQKLPFLKKQKSWKKKRNKRERQLPKPSCKEVIPHMFHTKSLRQLNLLWMIINGQARSEEASRKFQKKKYKHLTTDLKNLNPYPKRSRQNFPLKSKFLTKTFNSKKSHLINNHP